MIKHTLKTTLLTLLATTTALAAAPAKPAARMPETTTTAFSSVLSEDTPIGVTGRPEWTSARRFTSTRVYIQKEPWEIGIESWWRIKHKRDGTIANRLLEEVEIGLPYRMQLDLYTQIEGNQDGDFHYQSFDVELRWALADWGKIWGNPTLYAEYKFADPDWGPDVYELKLLLGDSFAPRWHWGVNFVWEAETGGERAHEFQIAGGVSYAVIDGRLGIGIEALFNTNTIAGERGDTVNEFNIGPSIQWRVTRNFHIDVSCLFGTNDESTRQTGFLILGYDFGPGGHSERAYTPHSGMRN